MNSCHVGYKVALINTAVTSVQKGVKFEEIMPMCR